MSELSKEQFRRQKAAYWLQATEFWLTSNLRHVDDIGRQIVAHITQKLVSTRSSRPVLLDVGFGSAWLERSVRREIPRLQYIGIDSNRAFVRKANAGYSGVAGAEFRYLDIERSAPSGVQADLAVCAFSLFEMLDLRGAIKNISKSLRSQGHLYIITIDRAYLILAMSETMPEMKRLLQKFRKRRGAARTFQRIDTGKRLHRLMHYPSVLHYLDEYFEVCQASGMDFEKFEETDYTHRPIPKTYQHIIFRKR